jgi:hypothetical protein
MGSEEEANVTCIRKTASEAAVVATGMAVGKGSTQVCTGFQRACSDQAEDITRNPCLAGCGERIRVTQKSVSASTVTYLIPAPLPRTKEYL